MYLELEGIVEILANLECTFNFFRVFLALHSSFWYVLRPNISKFSSTKAKLSWMEINRNPSFWSYGGLNFKKFFNQGEDTYEIQ